ncbi:hypothetical protein ACF065_34720 [Streptomyces sp. NPDC015232]|uniref:hypothetical protein n=1 Tax=unclassified Streptomyces TaxID=2593676 RepID=UPI0036FF221C
MNHDQEEPEVIAVCHTASAVGRHFEELLADGTVYAWTEPPFGETYYPGEDDPDCNPICDCPGQWPCQFCMECAGCTACGQCTGPHVWPPLQT